MKPKWLGYFSVLVIVALIISSGIISQNYLDRTAAEMLASLETVKNNIEQSNWETSLASYTAFCESWQPVRENWVLFIDHDQINNVEIKLARLGEQLKAREQTETLAELSEIILLLQQIPESERLTWRNIL
jgi:hypothetical protein